MQYEVYLDSYFWMNFCLNCAVLYVAGLLKQYRVHGLRLLVGSAAGAALSCIGILLPLPGILRMTAWAFLCAAASVRCAYRISNAGALCMVSVVYLGAGGLIGAAVLWCRQLLQYITGRRISPVVLFAVTALCAAGIGGLAGMAGQERRKGFCRVVLEEAGRRVSLLALIDSGNGLKEPVTGRPVCIAGRESLSAVADEAYRRENPQKCKIIPYHSIGKAHGLMEGFVIDGMAIDTGEQSIKKSRVIVAICDNEISGGGSYQMILPPAMIKEEEEIT